MEICPVGAALTHADGQADMTKLTGAFRNYASAPKTSYSNEIINPRKQSGKYMCHLN